MRIQRFALTAVLSYRALFTWLNPSGYIATRIVAPIALTLVFGTVQIASSSDTTRAVIGGSLLAVVVSAVYGVTLGVANERTFGTLTIRATTPSGIQGDLIAKAVPHVLDGYLAGALTIAVAAAALDVQLDSRTIGAIVVAAGAASLSGAGLALLVASVSLWSRDTYTAPNVAEIVVALTSGVFVDPAQLPWGLGQVATLIPAAGAVEVGMQAATGGPLVWTPLLREIALAGVYGACGMFSVRLFARRAQREATHDLT